jgi:hypothetical protein
MILSGIVQSRSWFTRQLIPSYTAHKKCNQINDYKILILKKNALKLRCRNKKKNTEINLCTTHMMTATDSQLHKSETRIQWRTKTGPAICCNLGPCNTLESPDRLTNPHLRYSASQHYNYNCNYNYDAHFLSLSTARITSAISGRVETG